MEFSSLELLFLGLESSYFMIVAFTSQTPISEMYLLCTCLDPWDYQPQLEWFEKFMYSSLCTCPTLSNLVPDFRSWLLRRSIIQHYHCKRRTISLKLCQICHASGTQTLSYWQGIVQNMGSGFWCMNMSGMGACMIYYTSLKMEARDWHGMQELELHLEQLEL